MRGPPKLPEIIRKSLIPKFTPYRWISFKLGRVPRGRRLDEKHRLSMLEKSLEADHETHNYTSRVGCLFDAKNGDVDSEKCDPIILPFRTRPMGRSESGESDDMEGPPEEEQGSDNASQRLEKRWTSESDISSGSQSSRDSHIKRYVLGSARKRPSHSSRNSSPSRGDSSAPKSPRPSLPSIMRSPIHDEKDAQQPREEASSTSSQNSSSNFGAVVTSRLSENSRPETSKSPAFEDSEQEFVSASPEIITQNPDDQYSESSAHSLVANYRETSSEACGSKPTSLEIVTHDHGDRWLEAVNGIPSESSLEKHCRASRSEPGSVEIVTHNFDDSRGERSAQDPRAPPRNPLRGTSQSEFASPDIVTESSEQCRDPSVRLPLGSPKENISASHRADPVSSEITTHGSHHQDRESFAPVAPGDVFPGTHRSESESFRISSRISNSLNLESRAAVSVRDSPSQTSSSDSASQEIFTHCQNDAYTESATNPPGTTPPRTPLPESESQEIITHSRYDVCRDSPSHAFPGSPQNTSAEIGTVGPGIFETISQDRNEQYQEPARVLPDSSRESPSGAERSEPASQKVAADCGNDECGAASTLVAQGSPQPTSSGPLRSDLSELGCDGSGPPVDDHPRPEAVKSPDEVSPSGISSGSSHCSESKRDESCQSNTPEVDDPAGSQVARSPSSASDPADAAPNRDIRVARNAESASPPDSCARSSPSDARSSESSFLELKPEEVASLLEKTFEDGQEGAPRRREEISSRRAVSSPQPSQSSSGATSSSRTSSVLASLVSGDLDSDSDEMSSFWLEQARKETMDP